MKFYQIIFILLGLLSSCQNQEKTPVASTVQPLVGTWRLIDSKSITKSDTIVTTPPKDQEMVKIFNNTHFAFFTHDLKQGKITKPVFSAGSGTYKLSGADYQEHLVFCNERGWENKDFKFTVQFKKDTLVQSGIEKIDSLNIDHIIIETYVRSKL